MFYYPFFSPPFILSSIHRSICPLEIPLTIFGCLTLQSICSLFLFYPFFDTSFFRSRLREPELSHTPHTAFIVGRVFGRRCYAVCLTYSHKLSHHHVHIDFYSSGRYRTYLILFRISLIHLPLRLYRRFFLFHNLLLFL